MGPASSAPAAGTDGGDATKYARCSGALGGCVLPAGGRRGPSVAAGVSALEFLRSGMIDAVYVVGDCRPRCRHALIGNGGLYWPAKGRARLFRAAGVRRGSVGRYGSQSGDGAGGGGDGELGVVGEQGEGGGGCAAGWRGGETPGERAGRWRCAVL